MDTAAFLEAVWGDGLHSLCWLVQDRMRWVFARTPGEAAPAPRQLPTRDIWYGAHPLREEPPAHQRGDSSFVAQVVAIPADLDWADPSRRTEKELPDEATVRAALRSLGPDLQPSIVVHSGHGLQTYWKLDRPVVPEVGAELVARISARLAEVGLENGRQDLASIMRLPGSTNWKDPEHPVPVVVEKTTAGRFTPEWLRRHVTLPSGWSAGSIGGGTRHHGGAVTDAQLDAQNHLIEHYSAHSPAAGRSGVIYLWRPGKDHHGGHSATIIVGDQGEAVITVFSSNWPGIGPDNGEASWSWVLRGDHLVRAHLADSEELDALLEAGTALGAEPDPRPPPKVVVTDDDRLYPIDWSLLHRDDGEDIVPGLLVPGRWTQMVGAPKSGKSTLLLWTTLQTAHGVHPFDATPLAARRVLWLDGEMGPVDLADLIDGCGYDPELLSTWWAVADQPRLDTPAGAERLTALVGELGVEVLVLDGLNSFLSPGFAEKDDQGWRSLFRLTIAPLKRAGLAIVSSDNLGKDITKGSRGSSVKTDKADVVYAVTRTNDGVKLQATHRRTVGFAESVTLAVEGVSDNDNRRIRYARTGGPSWPVGTKDCRAAIEELGLPADAGWPTVDRAFKVEVAKLEAMGGDSSPYRWRKTTVQAAIRWRKADPR